nr:CHAT domain-containing tetratricopeptide repeat protein [Sphingobium terrigena]
MMLALAAVPSLPVAAQTVAGFSAADPRHAHLRALDQKATTLFENDDFALSMSQKTRDAWAALRDAGIKVKVAGHPHPMAGVGLIKLGSMDQIEGKNPSALANVDKGLALIAPFRDAYPIPWLEGMSVKGYVQSMIGDVAAGAETLAQASAYADGYFARVGPKALSEADYMLKSNIAFSHAQALSRLGRNGEAVDAQRASLEARTTSLGPNHPDTVAATYTYAQMLYRATRLVEAEKYARLAVNTATDHVDRKHPSYHRSLEMLGLLLARTGRRVESLDYMERAIAIKRETMGTKSLFYHFGLYNMAGVLLPMERYSDAEPLFLEAERGFRAVEGENSPQSARALAFAALVSAASGRPDEVIERARTAMARVRTPTASDRDMGQRVYPLLVPALIATGQDDAARIAATDYLRETRQIDNAPAFALANAAMLAAWAQGGDAVAAARQMAGLLRESQSLDDDGDLNEDQRAALDTILKIAVQAHDPALALDAMAVLAGSRIAQANRLVAERLVADPALAARVRTLQDRLKALASADSALLKALATDKDVEAARVARATVETIAEAERAAIARDYPRWVEARGGVRPDLATLRAGLAQDEALLAVMPAFDGVYLLAVNADGATVERTALGRAAMVALVDRLRGAMTPNGFDRTAAHDIYTQIFTPAILARLGKAKALRIVPTGAFASLPFAMLPQRPVVTVGQDTPWLIRRFAIEVQPGFATSTAAPQRIAMRNQSFLGVGAPDAFAATTKPATPVLLAANHYFRGGNADATALAELPPLPGSLAELRAVADRFGTDRATLLVGAQASEAALRGQDLAPYSVILFATHGLVSGQMEGVTEPALVLSPPAPGTGDDGLLTASEVAAMRIGADWVILSACNTAAGDSAQAPAYSGLAQAFRYAGAGSLLVSHWPVRDDASAFVTLETVKATNGGTPRAVALQRAMLKLMRSKRPDAAQPYIWAPFILVGR